MAKGKSKSKALSGNKDAASLILAPHLYLGPCSSASSAAFLTAAGITHVLSIGSTPTSTTPNIIYSRLPLTDSPTSPLDRTTAAACAFIDSVHADGGKVLVHCSAAISRSPTVIVAYLMKSQAMTLRDALGRVIRARPSVNPNPGFLAQLKEMEKEQFGEGTLEVDELPRRKEDREAMFILHEKEGNAIVDDGA